MISSKDLKLLRKLDSYIDAEFELTGYPSYRRPPFCQPHLPRTHGYGNHFESIVVPGITVLNKYVSTGI